MRKALGLIGMTLAVFVACGSDENSQPPPTGSDGGTPPDNRTDAAVQPDGAAPPNDGGTEGSGPVPRGFEIQSTDVVIMPAQEVTYCYHFATPNTVALPITKWKSAMTPGIRYMAMFIGGSSEPAGTLTAACPDLSNASASNTPAWAYASSKAEAELAFPSDDGTGKPLGFELAPGTKGYLLMYHLNETAQPITAHVTLSSEALPEGVAFTKTNTFTTYNSDISIPAFATNHAASRTCDTLPNTKFWSMTMHAHKQAVSMKVKNGASASTNIAYESSDWTNPTQKTWPANPFYTFEQGKLTSECVYTNSTNREIRAGGSFSTDETCMSTGYYFPATKPVLCYCLDAGCINF